MADRIEINFTANVREVMKGTDQIADSLKDTERALDSVGTEGEQSLERVTRAQDDVVESTGRVGTALGEVGGIAKSALEGDVVGAVDAAGQSVVGLSALIPGVGGLVGAGLGTVLSEGIKLFTASVDEEAKASEDRIQSMYDSFIESGVNYLTTQQALNALGAISGDTERVAELAAQQKELGVDLETILAAQVQGGQQRNEVLARANDIIAELNQKLEDGTYTEGTRLVTVEAIRDEYLKLNGEQSAATQGAELFRSTSALITGELTKSTEEIQKANKLLAETPRSVPVKLEVDDSDLTAKLGKSRTVQASVELYTRSGTRII